MKLRLATADDAAAIAGIYAPFVTGTAVSFETDPPDEAEMRARIAAGGDMYPWLVACGGDEELLGYAYAAAFRSRHAYRFAVETTVYLAPAAHGRGIGHELYAALIPTLEAQGFTQAIAAISLPNAASVRLHEKHGFAEADDIGRVADRQQLVPAPHVCRPRRQRLAGHRLVHAVEVVADEQGPAGR